MNKLLIASGVVLLGLSLGVNAQSSPPTMSKSGGYMQKQGNAAKSEFQASGKYTTQGGTSFTKNQKKGVDVKTSGGTFTITNTTPTTPTTTPITKQAKPAAKN